MVKDIYSKRDLLVRAISAGDSVREIVSNIKLQVNECETDSVIAPGDWDAAKNAEMVHITEVEGDGAFRILFDTPEISRCLEIAESNILFREADWDTETKDALNSTARDWYQDAQSSK